MITEFEAFENLVKSLHDHPTNGDKRYGQVYFTILSEVRPAIAELITGTLFDPFYKDAVHPRTSEIVERYWHFPQDKVRSHFVTDTNFYK
jgi:hypothetical protein